MAKKVTKKRASVKSKASMRSLQVYKNPKPFLSFIVTEQTYYWLIIMVLVLMVYVWVVLTQNDISNTINTTSL